MNKENKNVGLRLAIKQVHKILMNGDGVCWAEQKYVQQSQNVRKSTSAVGLRDNLGGFWEICLILSDGQYLGSILHASNQLILFMLQIALTNVAFLAIVWPKDYNIT